MLWVELIENAVLQGTDIGHFNIQRMTETHLYTHPYKPSLPVYKELVWAYTNIRYPVESYKLQVCQVLTNYISNCLPIKKNFPPSFSGPPCPRYSNLAGAQRMKTRLANRTNSFDDLYPKILQLGKNVMLGYVLASQLSNPLSGEKQLFPYHLDLRCSFAHTQAGALIVADIDWAQFDRVNANTTTARM